MTEPHTLKYLIGFTVSLVTAALGITLSAATQSTARGHATFNEVYEICLVSYTETGIGRDLGRSRVAANCLTYAERESGGPQPTPSAYTAQYQNYLLQEAASGAPPKADLAVYCGAVATGITGEQPPDKRYVVFQKPGSSTDSKPTYDDAYAICLMGAVVTGYGQRVGVPQTIAFCSGEAEKESGGPAPTVTPFDDIYQRCLLNVVLVGKPLGDMDKICRDEATSITAGPPPNTTRNPR
jgi:hypothetical protein